MEEERFINYFLEGQIVFKKTPTGTAVQKWRSVKKVQNDTGGRSTERVIFVNEGHMGDESNAKEPHSETKEPKG